MHSSLGMRGQYDSWVPRYGNRADHCILSCTLHSNSVTQRTFSPVLGPGAIPVLFSQSRSSAASSHASSSSSIWAIRAECSTDTFSSSSIAPLSLATAAPNCANCSST